MAQKLVIECIALQCFKSIREEVILFDNPTFLVGPNGSGKSNLVSAIAFVADAMSIPLQTAFDNHGGVDNVRYCTPGRGRPPVLHMSFCLGKTGDAVGYAEYGFSVAARANHGFDVKHEYCQIAMGGGESVSFERDKEGFNTTVLGLSPSVEPTALSLPLVAGNPAFAPVHRALSSMMTYSIDTGAVRELQEPDSGLKLKRDGSNAASVLRELGRTSPGDVERISELLAAIVPGTKKVAAKKLGNKLTVSFTQEWDNERTLDFYAFSMSDGTLRALGLLLALFQKPTPSLVVIEEPEATIHPGALGVLLDALRHASRKTQVVVTTHSPDVLDAKWIEDRHIRIVEWREGATRVAPLAESSRDALRERLMGAGELLRSNALHAAPEDGPDVGRGG